MVIDFFLHRSHVMRLDSGSVFLYRNYIGNVKRPELGCVRMKGIEFWASYELESMQLRHQTFIVKKGHVEIECRASFP